GRLSAPRHDIDAAAMPLAMTWQELNENAERVFNLDTNEERQFTITPDGVIAKELDLDGLFIKRHSTKLLVVFHGALAREKFILPRFEYQRALQDFDGSVLFLQDPTLYVHKDLTLGWYIGNHIDNAHSMIEHLINIVANVLEPTRVLLTGSRGGGFAALAISAKIAGSS